MIGFYRELHYLGYFGLLLPIAGKPPPRWEQLGAKEPHHEGAWMAAARGGLCPHRDATMVAHQPRGLRRLSPRFMRFIPVSGLRQRSMAPNWMLRAFLLRRLVGLHEPQQWNYVEPISMILFLGSIRRLLPCL